ncbi:MAG: type II toxin-antitoxin system VapC family toxin [Pseudomonadota bacterium]|nr:type II toxin-antitoxin system VapC family toxin [Pseudomonadota bacterium]
MTRRVYLDTCCVIYLLEDVPSFSEAMYKRMADNLDCLFCVSPLVRLEALVKPSMDGDRRLIDNYEYFLHDQEWLSMSDTTFDQAMWLRAKHRIKTQDALHLAVALQHECAEFWTNDGQLVRAMPGFVVNAFSESTSP